MPTLWLTALWSGITVTTAPTPPPLFSMSFDLVLFGGTGDLVWRKLMPALFQAFRHGSLPVGGRIIGVARDDLSDDAYRAFIKDRFDEVELDKMPEIPVKIYDLGLIYTIDINSENDVNVTMTLTAPGCPVAGEMPGWVVDAVEPLAGVKSVNVDMTFDPQWGMEMMSDEARLELGFM